MLPAVDAGADSTRQAERVWSRKDLGDRRPIGAISRRTIGHRHILSGRRVPVKPGVSAQRCGFFAIGVRAGGSRWNGAQSCRASWGRFDHRSGALRSRTPGARQQNGVETGCGARHGDGARSTWNTADRSPTAARDPRHAAVRSLTVTVPRGTADLVIRLHRPAMRSRPAFHVEHGGPRNRRAARDLRRRRRRKPCSRVPRGTASP
jgi:hypothetical protein